MKTIARSKKMKLIQPTPTPLYWLSLNLWDHRRRRKLTQEELAAKANMSARAYRYIETAVPEANPELNTIVALADALGLEIRDLFKPRPDLEIVDV